MFLIPIHRKEERQTLLRAMLHKAEYKAKSHWSKMSKRKEIREKRYTNLVMSQPNHERSVQGFFRPQKLSVDESTVKHNTRLSLIQLAQIPLKGELLSHELQLIWHKPSWKPGYIGHSWSSCFTAAGTTNSSLELRYFSLSTEILKLQVWSVALWNQASHSHYPVCMYCVHVLLMPK